MFMLVYIEQKKTRTFVEYVTDKNKYDQKINTSAMVNIEEILKF